MEAKKMDLYRATPPWVVLRPATEEDAKWNPTHLYGREGTRVEVKELRGQRMRSRSGLMGEFAAALQFFDGFGGNWHALKECLCYLDEWMPADAYVLLVTSCHELLVDGDQAALEWLIVTLQEAGAFPQQSSQRFEIGSYRSE